MTKVELSQFMGSLLLIQEQLEIANKAIAKVDETLGGLDEELVSYGGIDAMDFLSKLAIATQYVDEALNEVEQADFYELIDAVEKSDKEIDLADFLEKAI